MARRRRVPKQRVGMKAKAGTTKSATACVSKRIPPVENSCHKQAGLYSISSELNNSPKNHHIYGQTQLDILNADFSDSATDGGGGTGFSLNALSFSGSIGYQSDSAM